MLCSVMEVRRTATAIVGGGECWSLLYGPVRELSENGEGDKDLKAKRSALESSFNQIVVFHASNAVDYAATDRACGCASRQYFLYFELP